MYAQAHTGLLKRSLHQGRYSPNSCYYVVCVIASNDIQAEDSFTINDEGKELIWPKGIAPHLQAAKEEVAVDVDHPAIRAQVGTGPAPQAIHQEIAAEMPQRETVKSKTMGRIRSAHFADFLFKNAVDKMQSWPCMRAVLNTAP